MLECPKCAGDAKVVDSRAGTKADSINFLRRRRACEDCGYRYTTYEMSQQDFQDYQVMLKGITVIRKNIKIIDNSFKGIEQVMQSENKYSNDAL